MTGNRLFGLDLAGKHGIIYVLGFKIKFKQNLQNLLPHINKKKTEKQFKDFKGCGINHIARKKKIIVSLTSFPQRMYDIHYALFSLLTQNFKPDAVILWLAKDEFPDREKDIPEKVLRLRENGLQIRWCDNLRSYKKLVPALLEFSEDVIVTADDDLFYSKDWLEKLFISYQENPEDIHCHRGYRIEVNTDGKPTQYGTWKQENSSEASPLIFFTGGGGVLYPPHSLDELVVNKELFQNSAPTADDIWFWAMAVKKGTKIKIVKNNIGQVVYINPERELNLNGEMTLFDINKTENGNDAQLKNVLEMFPQIITRLMSAAAEKS